MLKKGLFITFEGADGTGKSTQIAKTADYLKEADCDVVITREPGGSRISEMIRDILLDPDNKEMTPETEALLYAAARAQHVKEQILPSLADGKTVICDRYVDSSLAYQGHARGLGMDKIFEINKLATKDIMPDITFYLDLPIKTALDRRGSQRPFDRMEQNGTEFMELVSQGYKILAKQNKGRIFVIDAGGTQQDVFKKIKDILDKKII